MRSWDDYTKYLEDEMQAQPKEERPDQGIFGSPGAEELVKIWTEDNIPEELRTHPIMKNTWAFRSNGVKLTFLDKQTEEEFITLGEISRAWLLMGIPEYEYSTEMMLQEEQIFLNFRCNLRRAVGMESNKHNERSLQSGSFNISMKQNTEAFRTESQPRGGMFKFFGKR